MDRFTNALMVYPEQHPNVVRQVMRMVEQTGARLTIADVVPDIDSEIRWLPQGMVIDDLMRNMLAERQAEIESTLAAEGELPESISVRVRHGKPAVEYIRAVMSGRNDLMIKVAVGGEGLYDRLFGTTAAKLMRHCPTPVWLIKPSPDVLPRRVVAALDPMGAGSGATALNHGIIDLAAAIAAFSGGTWEALHIWRVPGESLFTHGRNRMSRAELDRLNRMTESFHRERLENLLNTVAVRQPPAAVHLIKGEPERMIPEFVQRHQIDLVVMGTVTQPGIGGWLAGSTAEQALRVAGCSLMILKPEGFVSAVRPIDAQQAA